MGNHRARGPDRVPIEVLRCTAVMDGLVPFYNRILQEGAFPEEWFKIYIIPLLKKGDRTNPSNYRGIALQSHCVKLFFRILMLRMRSVMDPHLLPAQAGYRPGRSTAQHIAALMGLIDVTRTHDMPLHAVFVDFTKAFDSVDRSSVERILQWWGVPSSYIRCIMNFWSLAEVQIRLDPSKPPAGQTRTNRRPAR